ncbi:MAG: bifunctional serine/threonine-protein kinase/ABC transporter substrate-binding protein [Actinomycetota bacterium]
MAENPDHKLIEAALPGYEIGVELGRGAWGVVLSGRHKRLGRQVAIKQLPRQFGSDPGVAGRFLREAQMAASLDHPHIVPVYDYVEEDGLGLIVMEQCSTTVGAKFTSEGLHTDEACYAALATCSALSYAHGRGVLHRDIKPENLLMDGEGRVKLGDFGIARAVDEATRLTATGTVIGTPAYMSPEQASGRDLGPGSDVYSIGVVLYELLSGTLPFTDVSTFGALIRQHLTEPPRPLLDVAPDVPTRIAAAVDNALVKDPEERWPTATDFGVALGEATSQAFGAGWPRQRRFSLSGSAEILAATEREIGGDPRAGSVHVGGDPVPGEPVTGPATSAPTTTSGENQPHSMAPPIHPTSAPPAAPSSPTPSSPTPSSPTPSSPTPTPVPAPTAEHNTPPVAPPPLPTPGVSAPPPGPGGPPQAPGAGNWSAPTQAAPGTPSAPTISPLAGTPPATSPPATPQWPGPGAPVFDDVAGSGGGGPIGPPPVPSSGGGSSRTPLILGGAAVVLLGLIGVVGLLALGGDDDEPISGSETTLVDTGGQPEPSETTTDDTTTDSSAVGPVGDALVIGTLLDDGEFANDEDLLVAMDLAFDDIEAAGGVLGQPLSVLRGPYVDDSALAITAGQHVAAGAGAVIGPTDPVDTDDVLGVVTSGGTVLMSPTDFFSREDDSGLYFQTRVPNTLEGEAAASLVDPSADDVVLVRPEGSFLANEAVIEAIIERLNAQGTDVTIIDIVDDDFVTATAQIIDEDPDALLVYAVIDKATFYRTLVDAGLTPSDTPWIAVGDDGAAIDSGDGLITGVRGVTVDYLTGNALEERLPAVELSAAAANAYDAVIVVALAAEAAGATDGASIAAALPAVTGGGQQCTSFADCKALLADGADIDYVGPGGSYDLSAEHGRPESGFFRSHLVGDNGFVAENSQLQFDRNS